MHIKIEIPGSENVSWCGVILEEGECFYFENKTICINDLVNNVCHNCVCFIAAYYLDKEINYLCNKKESE